MQRQSVDGEALLIVFHPLQTLVDRQPLLHLLPIRSVFQNHLLVSLLGQVQVEAEVDAPEDRGERSKSPKTLPDGQEQIPLVEVLLIIENLSNLVRVPLFVITVADVLDEVGDRHKIISHYPLPWHIFIVLVVVSHIVGEVKLILINS